MLGRENCRQPQGSFDYQQMLIVKALSLVPVGCDEFKVIFLFKICFLDTWLFSSSFVSTSEPQSSLLSDRTDFSKLKAEINRNNS